MTAILFLISLGASLLGAKTGAWWLCLVSAGLLFPAVWLLPWGRRRENLFMFVLSSFTLIPLNLSLIRGFLSMELPGGEIRLFRAAIAIVLYAVAWNLEEVLLGLVTRLIWPKQYRLFSGIQF